MISSDGSARGTGRALSVTFRPAPLKVRFARDPPLEEAGFEPSVPGDKPWVPSWKMVRVLQVPAWQAIPQYDAAGMLGSALS